MDLAGVQSPQMDWEAENVLTAHPVFSRYKESENIKQFVTDLKLLVKDCSFKELDEIIRESIVFGTNSRKFREKLINVGKDLTLDKATDIIKSMEAGDEVVHSVKGDQRFRKELPKSPSVMQKLAKYMW